VTYEVRFSRSAKRALTTELPEKIATAVWNFVMGALRDNPQRVGKQLKPPLFPLYSARRGEYRVIYRIVDDVLLIEIVAIAHRRDSYR
jgi:mRNA interferase RelE/StbE